MTQLTPTQLDRFEAKIAYEPNCGCWLWLGHLNNNGYGRFQASEKAKGTYYAHRISYEHFNGEIPDGKQIDHLCRVRCCVNPKHLQAVTHQENLGRRLHGPRKLHCGNGHPFTEENTYTDPKKRRRCRICFRALNKRYKVKLREKKRNTLAAS